MEIEVLAIELHEEPIELCKLLKIANLVGGGGEAKMVITEGYVYLNGEVEYQKRKKVYFEDIVQFNGEAIMPVLSYDDIEAAEIDLANTAVKEQPKQHSKEGSLLSDKPKKAPKAKSSKPKHNKNNKNKNVKNQKANPTKPKTNSRSGRKSISF